MINLKKVIFKICTLAALLAVAACGMAEWPPRGDYRAPRASAPSSREEAPPPQAAPRQSVSSVQAAPLDAPAGASQAQPAPDPVSAPAPQRQPRGGDLTFIGANAVKVGPGDTLYAISRRHKVSIRPLIEANGLEPPYALQVGQRLVLPRGRQHKVSAGDTLYNIAQRYDVEPYETARINGLKPPYTVKLGVELLIPEGRLQDVRPPAEPAGARPAPEPAPAAAPAPVPPRPPVRNAEATLAAVPAKAASGFFWPADGRVISRFGVKRSGLRNDGINIQAAKGSPVRAAENGVVAYVGNELRGFGNLILVKHADGWISAYAHTDQLHVAKGDQVRRGQKIATVGDTGGVGAPQLHFELRKDKRAVDPQKLLNRKLS